MRYIDTPAKVLECTVTSAVGHEKWPHDDGLGDPFWLGGATPKDYRWVLSLEVNEQSHSSYKTRKPYAYNGMDVKPGDYIASQQDGVALKIISILSKSETSLQILVEDTLRYNTLRSAGGVGAGMFQVPAIALVFELNEDGLPVVDPIPPAGVSPNFYANLMSRFQNMEKTANFILYKQNHGFQTDQLISVDPLNGSFVLTDADHPFMIGTVSYNELGPDHFAINPIQKIIDNMDSLIGGIGSVLYADDSSPGALTLTPGTKPVMIKLRNQTQSVVTGTVAAATTTPGNQFLLNHSLITVGGAGTAANFTQAVNSMAWQHGVLASQVQAPTVLRSSLAPAMGEPALNAPAGGPYATAVINGVLVTFSTNTTGMAIYGGEYALEEDMASDINAAGISNIVASTETNILVLTNTAGGPINIESQTPDAEGILFAGENSGSGLPTSAPMSTQRFVKLTATDARAINLHDVRGTPTRDFGLVSVENGQKAAALYVEHGIREAVSTVVPDLASRGALSPKIGDQAYVLDKGDGEWGLYLFDGTSWEVVATYESAKTDADTFSVDIAFDSMSSGLIGEINGGSRVNSVVVTILEPFDGAASLTVGYHGDHALLMNADQNDLANIGEYTTTPSHIFLDADDVNIEYYLTCSGCTKGTARVSISYM